MTVRSIAGGSDGRRLAGVLSGAVRILLRREHLALGAILLLAFGIRLIGLGDRLFWGDELFAMRAARKPIVDLFFPQMIDNGTQIGFYLVAHLWVTLFPWAAAPIDESLMRALPLLFSVATIPLVYLLTARVAHLLGLRGARATAAPLLAAALLAVSPFAVRYAQEFRTYSLQLFLLTLASLLLLRVSSAVRPPRGWWLLYGLLASAAVYAHMLSAVFLAAQAGSLFLVALVTRRGGLALDLVKAALLGAIAVAPLALTLLRYGSSPMSWVPPLSLQGVIETLSHLAAVAPGFETATALSGLANMPGGPIAPERLALLLVALLPAAIGAGLLIAARRRAPVLLALFVAPLLLVPLFFAASSLVAAKIWWTRYLLPLLLPTVLLTAVGALEIVRRARLRLRQGQFIQASLLALLLVAVGVISAGGLASVLDRRAGPDWNISHRAALAAAQARWRERGVERYSFTLEMRCYCGAERSGPFRVSVDGETVSVSRAGLPVGGAVLAELPLDAAALYRFIERELEIADGGGGAMGPEGLRVVYDEASGLPTRVWANPRPGEPREAILGFNLGEIRVEAP